SILIGTVISNLDINVASYRGWLSSATDIFYVELYRKVVIIRLPANPVNYGEVKWITMGDRKAEAGHGKGHKDSFARSIARSAGPGVITGASDDDPSGIATYSQAGAQFGFGMLWMALFQYPLMTAVQEMCARIGLVTGDG